jgi:hypothetical protein
MTYSNHNLKSSVKVILGTHNHSYLPYCKMHDYLLLLPTATPWCLLCILSRYKNISVVENYMCTVILPQQINYKQKNDKASDTTHSKIKIRSQNCLIWKQNVCWKSPLCWHATRNKKKINQKINDEVSNITHISN